MAATSTICILQFGIQQQLGLTVPGISDAFSFQRACRINSAFSKKQESWFQSLE